MKFSENWLRTFVDPPADRAELCKRLTMAGLEVESVTPLGQSLDGVVVAEIVAAEKHPNADKLRVCQVKIGADAPLQIVCGAPNARVGLKAPLAMIGAKLPNGLEIKKAALRGVESNGMLCSADELGLAGDTSGLMELPADAPVGEKLEKLLALPDATIELKLTPNRPDCLGLRGLASEVGTLFAVANADTAVEPVPASIASSRTISLDAPADCPRYVGRVIEDVDATAPTPLWMKERLRRAGLRPISAVVDCTNYVMLELGQPMHAFDHDRIDGGIRVRRARSGETLDLLDRREVKLDPEFLLIADEKKALALAGVMGGHESRVTDATKNLFLEAAHFAPPAIVGRARKLGMHTDASHRFERGVDPELPRAAMERLTALLLGIVGGKPGPLSEGVAQKHLPERNTVTLREQRLARVLGMTVPGDRVEAILRGLDMTVEPADGGWRVTPPSRRFDVAIEEDLIEEVVRVHGYDEVPVKAPSGIIASVSDPEGRVDAHAVRRVLTARGYSEAVNFSFVAKDLLQTWQVEGGAVALANPLSAELGVMRTSLLPGLVDAARRNAARQQSRVRLFEIGATFHATGPTPAETARVAAIATGAASAEQWGVPRRPIDFHDIKGEIEQLLALGGAHVEGWCFDALDLPYLHPGRSAAVRRGEQRIGLFGNLHPRLAKALDLDPETYVFELDLEPLVEREIPRAGEMSRFPSIRRDIAVVVDRSVPYANLATAIRKAVGGRLRDLVLFDEFVGKGLPAGARSLAIGLILQDDSRTLTDLDADESVQSAVAALGRDFGAELRS